MKKKLIKNIKEVVAKWEEIDTKEVEFDGSCPIFKEIDKDEFQRIEKFKPDTVVIRHYVGNDEIDEFEVPYEELTKEQLEQSLDIVDCYDAVTTKLMNSCKDYNY